MAFSLSSQHRNSRIVLQAASRETVMQLSMTVEDIATASYAPALFHLTALHAALCPEITTGRPPSQWLRSLVTQRFTVPSTSFYATSRGAGPMRTLPYSAAGRRRPNSRAAQEQLESRTPEAQQQQRIWKVRAILNVRE